MRYGNATRWPALLRFVLFWWKVHTSVWVAIILRSGQLQLYVVHKFITSFSPTITKLKGLECATLEKLPNIAQFNPVATHTITSKSLLLQACLNNMAKEHRLQVPVVNVVLPNNFWSLFLFWYPSWKSCWSHCHIKPTSWISSFDSYKLLQGTFCHVYVLPDSIKNHLHEHKITGTHTFVHMTSDHLREMEFKLGESIDLKEVIKCWAQGGAWTILL